MEVPPPFANLQASRGAERRSTAWQEEPGGGWRRAGVYGKIFISLFIFIQEVCFHSLGSSGVVGPAWTSFWLTEWNERRQIG